MTDFFNSVGMEYVLIGLAAALLLALILVIVALVKVWKLKKRYEYRELTKSIRVVFLRWKSINIMHFLIWVEKQAL